jgi:riboflavin synthase
MFTGLILDVGQVESVTAEGQSVHLELRTTLAADLALGDSLAVNGVCLTVTRTDPGGGSAVVTAIPETLTRSTLGRLSRGGRVNLEPALRVGDRMGGHMVQGHVDGVGTVARRSKRGLSIELTIEAPEEILRYVVEKGSIAIDGVSLTVAALSSTGFTVALIPHTLGATTLEERRAGDMVNLEVDILAKYVERMLGAGRGSGITEEYLRRHGFA